MASVRASLSGQISWTSVWKLAGFPLPPQEALPLTTWCPLCEQDCQLTLYTDFIGGGEWIYCRHCRFSGDAIHLVAAKWRVAPEEALYRLFRRGLQLSSTWSDQDLVLRQLKQTQRNQKSLQEFWERCRQRVLLDPLPELNRVAQAHRLFFPFHLEHWLNGPGRLVGYASPSDIKRLKTDTTVAARLSRHPQIVCPYWMAPQYILGFWSLEAVPGKETGNLSGQGMYVPVNASMTTWREPAEAGLAGLPALDLSARGWGSCFAVGDPLLLLRWQMQYALTSSRLLPLVAWHEGFYQRTRRVWENVARPVVLLCEEPDAALYVQARCADARIFVANWHSRRGLLRSAETEQNVLHLLKLADKMAQPWKYVLARHLNELAERRCLEAIETLLLGLETRGLDLQDLLHQLQQTHRLVHVLVNDRLQLLTQRRRAVQVGFLTVVEHEDGWYWVRRCPRATGEQLLTDAILRIYRVWSSPQREFQRYEGAVLHRGRRHLFECAAQELDQRPFRTLIQICLSGGSGRPQFRCPNGVDLVSVAMAFHLPEVVEVVDHEPSPRVSGPNRPAAPDSSGPQPRPAPKNGRPPPGPASPGADTKAHTLRY